MYAHSPAPLTQEATSAPATATNPDTASTITRSPPRTPSKGARQGNRGGGRSSSWKAPHGPLRRAGVPPHPRGSIPTVGIPAIGLPTRQCITFHLGRTRRRAAARLRSRAPRLISFPVSALAFLLPSHLHPRPLHIHCTLQRAGQLGITHGIHLLHMARRTQGHSKERIESAARDRTHAAQAARARPSATSHCPMSVQHACV